MGKFIVFEGVEGAGKTTQIERVSLWLKAYYSEKIPIITTREPGGTTLGQKLRGILLDEEETNVTDLTELLLYAADRTQHINQVIKPHLQRGGIVLCDRYTDSTIAYQGYGRGLSLDLINQLNQIATGGLESDITFWLDVDVKTGLERARSRGKLNRMESANLAFHQRVYEGFHHLAQTNPHRIVPINANRTAEEVQQQIQQVLEKELASKT